MNLTKALGALFCIGLFVLGALVLRAGLEQFFYGWMFAPLQRMVYTQIPPVPPEIDLGVRSALSVRVNFAGRKKIVLSREPQKKLPIASITKLMTALIVFDNPKDYPFTKVVVISSGAAAQYDVPISGNLKPGEIYTVKDLLKIMMYYSSNDAAYALAEVIGVDRFVGLMNSRAKELGLLDTGFGNVNGLDNGAVINVSTANDLLNLAQYIIKNQSGIFVFSTTPGELANENGIFNISLPGGHFLVGGKTGFTAAAGGCMLLVFRDAKNNYYFNVILGSQSSEDRVVQMQKLVNYDIVKK